MSVVVWGALCWKFNIEVITVFTTDILFLLYICIYNCRAVSCGLCGNSDRRQIQYLHDKWIFCGKSWWFFQIASWLQSTAGFEDLPLVSSYKSQISKFISSVHVKKKYMNCGIHNIMKRMYGCETMYEVVKEWWYNLQNLN
jgi:hypothetical protein